MKKVLFLMAAMLTTAAMTSCDEDPLLEPKVSVTDTSTPTAVQDNSGQTAHQLSNSTKLQKQ